MSQPRFTKKRSESSLCLALMLVCLVGWVVLSTRFSSQAAAVASDACSTPSFLTAEFIYHFSNSGPVASGDFNGDHHLDLNPESRVSFLLLFPGLSRTLQPWAEISERLRRNFKVMHKQRFQQGVSLGVRHGDAFILNS